MLILPHKIFLIFLLYRSWVKLVWFIVQRQLLLAQNTFVDYMVLKHENIPKYFAKFNFRHSVKQIFMLLA